MIVYSSSTNKIIAIRQLVHTLCIFYFQDVTPRELDVLCEIINIGEVNYKVKNSFMINYKTTKENYAQILNRLTKKGILIPKENRTGKELHRHFLDIKGIIDGFKERFLVLEYKAS